MGRRLAAVHRVAVEQGLAELVPDPDRPDAWTLYVDGTPQSHVDLGDPTFLEFEYVRWLGHLVDLMAPAGEPLTVLHLGGGAWTLARYVAATRPGSRQRVVEIDGALVELVRSRLPQEGAGIRVRVGDAREVLASLRDDTADLVVVDVYAGARVPAHLTSREFVAEAARVLRPTGVYASNVADGGQLTFLRRLTGTLGTVLAGTALVGSPQMLRGRHFGNALLLGGARGRLPIADLARRLAGDPFPARVTAGDDLTRFVAGAAVVTDEDRLRSPTPPDFLRS